MGYRPSVSPSLRATPDACQAVCRRPAGRPPSSQCPDQVLESARRSERSAPDQRGDDVNIRPNRVKDTRAASKVATILSGT